MGYHYESRYTTPDACNLRRTGHVRHHRDVRYADGQGRVRSTSCLARRKRQSGRDRRLIVPEGLNPYRDTRWIVHKQVCSMANRVVKTSPWHTTPSRLIWITQ